MLINISMHENRIGTWYEKIPCSVLMHYAIDVLLTYNQKRASILESNYNLYKV
jgi:hypothetical protein